MYNITKRKLSVRGTESFLFVKMNKNKEKVNKNKVVLDDFIE